MNRPVKPEVFLQSQKEPVRQSVSRPDDVLFATELPRMMMEFWSSALTGPLWLAGVPKGDGHTVMVLPGFLTDDALTNTLRARLKHKNFNAVGWEQGRNLHLNGKLFRGLEERLKRLADQSNDKISLVGHSLGGLIALALADRHPHLVRNIVTLGSPLHFAPYEGQTHAFVNDLFEFFNQRHVNAEPEFLAALRVSLYPLENVLQNLENIPVTSIYSNEDGVIAPASAIIPEHYLHHANLQIQGSHCGMPMNAQVMTAVADRLMQSAGQFERFNPSAYSVFWQQVTQQNLSSIFGFWAAVCAPPSKQGTYNLEHA